MTAPSLLTEGIVPESKDLIRRDLHLSLPYTAGKYQIAVLAQPFGFKGCRRL